jgi:hypothetical protein
MTHPIGVRFPVCTLHLALVFGLAAATLSGMLAGPAHAESDQSQSDNQNRRGNEGRQQGRQQGRQPVVQREHRQYQHRDNGYYRGPDVYDSAPPVIYQQPGYYEQPRATLNFIFPLVIR